ncbi:UNVERIFIED_CONTAM: Aspartyl protease family protein [Sesamum angustifolium]|uniref:Aspartyl protease family protein n=1 Tax=Sesamum angustifolium TaxID=2727405 RepID=A0AAW2MJ36_9LAMI
MKHESGSIKRQSTLQVVHRHGPCSQDKPTHAPPLSEILADDQSRVKSIQARLNPTSNTNQLKPNKDKFIDRKANLPAQSGSSLSSGNYIVSVGLGTPKKTLSLIFDTGSDLTWTQCQPCVGSCYQQRDPIFNPSSSTSYSNVSCSSSQCAQLSSATGNDPQCLHDVRLRDTNNQGLFGKTAGLLGLGRDPLSIVSQTAQKYGKYFSYCLPSKSSSTGHLTLGKGGASTNVKFTPFASSQGTSFYFIKIIKISVGGQDLPISQTVFDTAGSIIDSGTVITRLPPGAYSALSTAFQQQMKKYPSAPAYSILDTCYDFSNYTTITIPTVSFTFGGM